MGGTSGRGHSEIYWTRDQSRVLRFQDALGPGGDVTFSGVGRTEEQRRSTILMRGAVAGQQVPSVEKVGVSSQREDTNLVREALFTVTAGKNAMIQADDIDLLLIGILNVDALQESAVGGCGKLFIQMKAQKLDLYGIPFTEEFVCCDQLSESIKSNTAWNWRVGDTSVEVERSLRVPSIVALFNLLGGDTTSYMHLPYTKALTWYLELIEFVGSLVRLPNLEEASEGGCRC